MNCFLDSHRSGYSFSLIDLGDSLLTGFSGCPYAKRHFELAETGPQENSLCHKIIGVIEYLPILGGLAAVVEKIVFYVSTFFSKPPFDPHAISPEKMQKHIHWQDRNLSRFERECKMQKNADKALLEHRAKSPSAPFATVDEMAQLRYRPGQPLRLLQAEPSFYEARGNRPTMQDSHFHISNDRYIFSGIFDGHGSHRDGHKVARMAETRFPQIFTEKLMATLSEEGSYNIHKAFEQAFDQFEREVAAHPELSSIGCTATIVFIDKATRMSYTANLGDSEARLYTPINNRNKIIPMSPVRDWSSKFDAKRASMAIGDPRIEALWRNNPNPKHLRVGGVNVSRAFGDIDGKGTPEAPGQSHKPKISMQRIPDPEVTGRPSVIVLACDGVWDYAREDELANMISYHPPSTLATAIGEKSLRDWDSQDNVSVLTLTLT